jgi:hypothetical protein
MALDDYFSIPSQDCLGRLFDAINSMDLSAAPTLTRSEKLVMRSSERKDIFAEKFVGPKDPQLNITGWNANPGPSKPKSLHRPTNSTESYSSFEEGIMMRNKERERTNDSTRECDLEPLRGRERAGTESSISVMPPQQQNSNRNPPSPTDSSFTLGGSAVWVGDESGLEIAVGVANGPPSSAASVGSSTLVTPRGRRSTDASSSSSHGREHNHGTTATMTTSHDPQFRSSMAKDTHFYHTSIAYKEHQLPIMMPLSTFPEEVGDVGELGSSLSIMFR